MEASTDTERAGEPSGLPSLSPGMHLDPVDGACFMEYASLLAGQPWSDHPRCTHPALAQLARLVNDALPSTGRQRLVALVPQVIGLRGKDPRLTPELVLLCSVRASRSRHETLFWRWHRRWALRRLTAVARGGVGARWCALTDTVYRTGPAQRVMRRAVQQLSQTTPDELKPLLAAAIKITRARLHTAPALGIHIKPEPASASACATQTRVCGRHWAGLEVGRRPHRRGRGGIDDLARVIRSQSAG